MSIFRSLAGIFGILAACNLTNDTDKRTITNRNPHNRSWFEINGLKIWAVNAESAQAQHDRIRAHQAMRLDKSNNKVNYAA